MSDVYKSLAHSKWDCKYHVMFVPKRRRKAIFGNIRRQLGPILHALTKQKECRRKDFGLTWNAVLETSRSACVTGVRGFFGRGL